LRNIALSQVRAIKERLDRIDAEMEEDILREREARDAAVRELDDIVGLPATRPADTSPSPPSQPQPESSVASAQVRPAQPVDERAARIARAYKVLSLPEGADLTEVDIAYRKLAERCRSDAFPEGSPERETADAILQRLNEAYNTLREALNPLAGRFDKLEL
jgi:curved DNA-binding protein CbpA